MTNKIKLFFIQFKIFVLSCLLFPILLYSHANINGKVTNLSSSQAIEDTQLMLVGPYTQETLTLAPLTNHVVANEHPIVLTIEDRDIQANFSIVNPGSIVGSVLDNVIFLPIANAKVEIMRGKTVIASVFTDENGVYAVFDLAPNYYLVRVSAPGFQSGFQLGNSISNQTVSLDFALDYLPINIVGYVTHAVTKEPIADAKIDLWEEDILIDSVKSNKDGKYTFSKINPRTYKVTATATNFQIASQNINVFKDQLLTTSFALEPIGSILGQIVHAFTDEPIADACIGLWQNDALIASTHTDKNGYFILNGLGDYQLVMQASHFHDLEKSLQIPSMKTIQMKFKLVCLEPPPPTKIHIKIIYKCFAHQVNRIHCIKWDASPDPSVVSYYIYRDGKKIAKISADNPLIFNDEWRSGRKKTYQITAVNNFGQEGQPRCKTIK